MSEIRSPGNVIWSGYDLDLALASVGPGWAPMLKAIFAFKPEDIRIEQVKEKFGALTVYYNDHKNEEFNTLVEGMVSLSINRCEECGARGKPRSGGWVKTLCEVHANGREKTNIYEW